MTVVSLFLLLLFVPPSGEGEAPAEPHQAAQLLEQIKTASPDQRPLLIHRLLKAGAEALAATREARGKAADPVLREALSHAVHWQLAAKIKPVFEEGIKSQLTYDGQYAALKEEGPEVVDALLALLNDEATRFEIRLTACRALADVCGTGAEKKAGEGQGQAPEKTPERTPERIIVPKLQELYSDILLPEALREQIGILLAILGDSHTISKEIRQLEELAASEDPRQGLSGNIALAELFYRTRNYERAVACYDRILAIFDSVHEAQKKRGANAETLNALREAQALHYYNAACSYALHGNLKKAKDLLREAVQRQAQFYDSLKKDGDLAPLRQDPSYSEFLRELEKLFEKKSL